MNCFCCNRKIKFTEATYNLSGTYISRCCSECSAKWKNLFPDIRSEIISLSNKEIIEKMQNSNMEINEDNVDEFKENLDYIRKDVIRAENKGKENAHVKLEKEKLEKIRFKAQLVTGEQLNSIIVTTGYNIEGYTITDYKGVYSGECVLGTGFLSEFTASISDVFGISSDAFSEKLNQAKEYALMQLKKICIAYGANAIIGIDFDYITFSNNMIGVVANGTAVKIEKL